MPRQARKLSGTGIRHVILCRHSPACKTDGCLFRSNTEIVANEMITRVPMIPKWMTAENVISNVKRYARNGSIITFHDSLKSIDKLRTALPESIKWLKEQGYEFKTF